MNLGKNIKAIREKETKLSQEEVAKALGMSIKAYKAIEENNADILLTEFHHLSVILGVTQVYILSYKL